MKIGQHSLKLDKATTHGKFYSGRRWTLDTLISYSFLKVADVVLDVGANVGFTSLHYLAGGAKEVHAVEPHPRYAGGLRSLGASNLYVYECALGPHTGVATLYEAPSLSDRHTMSPVKAEHMRELYGAEPCRLSVPIKTWDGLFPGKRFNYVKIDADGYELSILRGGADALRYRKPRMVQVEAYGEDFLEIYDFLAPYYRKCFRATHTLAGELRMVSPATRMEVLRESGLQLDPPTFVFFS